MPLPVGLLLLVSEHRVPRHFRRVSRDVEVGILDAAPHVVVLASPAPELVRVTVHPLKVLPWLGQYFNDICKKLTDSWIFSPLLILSFEGAT